MIARVLPADTAVQVLGWGDVAGSAPEPAARVDLAIEAVPAQVDDVAARERAAFEAGLREGRAAALADVSGRVEAAVSRASAAAAELAGLAPRVRAAAQDDLVRLSIAIAQRILRREVAVDPDALAGIALAALERLNGREIRRVRVSPEDAAAVERHMLAAGAPPGFSVESDPSLERGSLVFEMAHGNLDASVWTQLAEIERGLAERARGGRP